MIQPVLAQPGSARSVRSGHPLPDNFRGTAAATGARLAAFTIDVVAVTTIAASVTLLASSALLGALTGFEALVFLWVLEARTGLTVGNAAFRIRTSRADRPFSPGIGRALVKDLVTGAGFLIAGIGAWAVVSSSAWDGRRLGRGWANLASGTLSVAVPHRAQLSVAHPGVSAPHVYQANGPAGRNATGLGAARVVAGLAPNSSSVEDSIALSQTGVNPGGGAYAIELTAPPIAPIAPIASPASPAPAAAVAPSVLMAPVAPVAPPAQEAPALQAPAFEPPSPQAPTAQPPTAQAPTPVARAIPAMPGMPAVPAAPSATVAPEAPSAPSAPAAEPAGEGTLLLIFDTGQREQIPLPAFVNLGRKPAAIDAADRLISVNDPEGTVSKTHVRLEHSRGRTWVTDQGSTNGTDLLDDDGSVIALQAGQRSAVEDGVRVRIGNRAFSISVLVGGGSQGGNS